MASVERFPDRFSFVELKVILDLKFSNEEYQSLLTKLKNHFIKNNFTK